MLFHENYPDRSDVYGIEWRPAFSRVQFLLSNPSDKNYDNLDLFILLDRSIVEGRVVSEFNACKFGPANAPPEGLLFGTAEDGQDLTIPVTPSAAAISFVPLYRLRCERLAARSQILMVLATIEFGPGLPANFDDVFTGSRSDPTQAHLEVAYTLNGRPGLWAMDIRFDE